MNCKQCDISCEGTCPSCPLCHHPGIKVPFETVQAFLGQDTPQDTYFLCTSRACEVGYYTLHNATRTQAINPPLWYKDSRNQTIICYCRNITLQDIIKASKKLDEVTIQSIIKYLGKESIVPKCVTSNPAGETCDRLFASALQFASLLNKKEEPK